MQTFKTINNYPNYEINSLGIIKNIKTNKILKPIITKYGYCIVGLYNNKKMKRIPIHRLIGIHFIPKLDNKYVEINHIDGNKQNNNISNLEWCTRSENILHAYKTGLKKRKNNSELQQERLKNKISIKVIDTNTLIIYKSIREAALNNNLTTSYLGLMLNNKRKNKTNLIFYKQT